MDFIILKDLQNTPEEKYGHNFFLLHTKSTSVELDLLSLISFMKVYISEPSSQCNLLVDTILSTGLGSVDRFQTIILKNNQLENIYSESLVVLTPELYRLSTMFILSSSIDLTKSALTRKDIEKLRKSRLERNQ